MQTSPAVGGGDLLFRRALGVIGGGNKTICCSYDLACPIP